MDILGGLRVRDYEQETAAKMQNVSGIYKPRTLREQLNDRIAAHKAEIAKLEEALEALSPDVEKALNALSKL